MAGQFLDPPISILDAGAGLDITFCVHRAEIGEVTSCSASTAKSRVRYAIAKLAELMQARQEISR